MREGRNASDPQDEGVVCHPDVLVPMRQHFGFCIGNYPRVTMQNSLGGPPKYPTLGGKGGGGISPV